MAIIRHLRIENFRSIRYAEWFPNPGLNCLIGPGDSGKSTFLDAIDLVLGARRNFSFSDADFYLMDTRNPVVISVTLGELDDNFKRLETYGSFLRGFNKLAYRINDEPQIDDEVVLTLQMTVREDLEPDWCLFSERTALEGLERRLLWKHRELLSPTRLGVAAHHHLAWGNRSLLNKLSAETFDVSSTLAQLSRQTRHTFAAQQFPQLTDILTQVRTIANRLGVPVGELKALLDVNGVSLSNGAISLHNNNNTPLRMLGTGSSRLLISGLQKATDQSGIILVDEAEYGLEPYRISRLLHELGSKDAEPVGQVFITTHSPYVLRELSSVQLSVLRSIPAANPTEPSHIVLQMGRSDEEQATLRACAEAFFSKAVIVGEGSTEVGFIRGLDLFLLSQPAAGFEDRGVYSTDGGGGDKYFKRAEIFARLGYKTALLKDSDITDAAHNQQTNRCRQSGVTVFEWGHGLSTEGALFNWCPLSVIPAIVDLAAELNGEQQVNQHIQNISNSHFTLETCRTRPVDGMRGILGTAAGKYKWFKTIAKSEQLTQSIVGPSFNMFNQYFQDVIMPLYQWAQTNGDQR